MLKPISIALDAMTPRVRAELTRPVQAYDPRNAEIVEGRDPIWVVIEVFAYMHGDVYKELVEHRFGVYVPEVDETLVRRGRKIDRRVPMFASYIFVFAWDIGRHWSWITSTPGVVGIVGALREEEIDIVRRVENQQRPVTIELPADQPAEVVPAKRSKKKKRWKGRKSAKAKAAKPKIITEADLRAEIITTRAWSAFEDVLELDSEGRNQTLRKALGLA